MDIVIYIVAAIVGIVLPYAIIKWAWLAPAQALLAAVIVAAEKAIPDDTKNATLLRVDHALDLWIEVRGLDKTKDAAVIEKAKVAIEAAVK